MMCELWIGISSEDNARNVGWSDIFYCIYLTTGFQNLEYFAANDTVKYTACYDQLSNVSPGDWSAQR